MAIINCENQNTKRPVNVPGMKKIAARVLEMAGFGKAGVDIVFVSNARMRALNRKYTAHDAATDVLAFQGPDSGEAGFGDKIFLGDIAISTDMAAQNAKKYGVPFFKETALYVIHGILHLTGHEDRTERGRRRMRRLENEFLEEVGKNP